MDDSSKRMPVQIAGVEITTDSEGRFNLNALHKASKLGADKAPSQWLRNKQTKELVEQLEKETVQICIVSVSVIEVHPRARFGVPASTRRENTLQQSPDHFRPRRHIFFATA